MKAPPPTAISAAILACCAVLLAARAAHGALDRGRAGGQLLADRRSRWWSILRLALDEGRIDRSFGSRRLLAVCLATGGAAGFMLVGPVGLVAGAATAPLLVRRVIRSRRRRHAARVDACTAELALALASSLAAGRSLRGALLTVADSIPEPLSGEVERAVVDLALGGNVRDALVALRRRTGSERIRSLVGAVELHRGSGGDLIKLMRELADAFRERDRALADAHSASAQARFTAYVVMAMPLMVGLALELAVPGSVSGTLTFLPTAMMMALAASLLAGGVILARRLGNAGA